MRIVILTQYYPPEIGAPQIRLSETAAGLCKLGWQVMVITAMPNYPTGRIFKEYRKWITATTTENGITIKRYPIYPSNSSRKLPRIFSMLSFSFTAMFSTSSVRRFKPDFIFTESPPITLGCIGLFLARLSRSKHILNVSDLWPLSAYELGALGKGKLYNMLERLEQYLYRASYACTGQSGDIIKHISQDGKRRTQLFRNGVDISRFHAVKYERAHKQIRLVYTGLIGVAQDILSLCKAIDFSQHSAELHIYGDGAERVQLQEYLNSCPNRNIFLHAPVSKSTIPELLGSYDCALIPLVKEIKGAVPSKIYEAMAAGLPIVFAGGGEGAQIVEEHALGWVCNPGDYANMQRIIKEVVATPPERIQQIRDNCRKAAENIFSRDKQILNLHQFLLSSK